MHLHLILYKLTSKQLIETGITKDNIVFQKCETIDEYLIRLTYIIIKAESDLYGGIQISDFDFLLAEAVNKNYQSICLNNIR
jgi:anaerobic ribonucleoside-triphosphate reductase